MKVVPVRKMRCGVVAILVSLAFVSQASAVLRPLFPIKPSAPFNGELIVIGDDFVLRSTKKPPMHQPVQAHEAVLGTTSATLLQRSPRAGDAFRSKRTSREVFSSH